MARRRKVPRCPDCGIALRFEFNTYTGRQVCLNYHPSLNAGTWQLNSGGVTELTNSAARQYLRSDRRHRLYTLHAETCPGKDFR